MVHIHLNIFLLVREGQEGEAWERWNKAMFFLISERTELTTTYTFVSFVFQHITLISLWLTTAVPHFILEISLSFKIKTQIS